MCSNQPIGENVLDEPLKVFYLCPVCNDAKLTHDPELNCFHCEACLYQWWPSRDYSDEKRLITNRGKCSA